MELNLILQHLFVFPQLGYCNFAGNDCLDLIKLKTKILCICIISH